MNAAAANALLKTLEEPPANTYLHAGVPSAGPLAGDDREPLPAHRRAAAGPREGRAWLAAQGAAAGRRRCSRRPATRRSPRSRSPMPRYQASARAWMTALAAPRALSVAALGARVDGGPRERARIASPRRSTGCSPGAPTWRASHAGGTPVQNPGFARSFAALAPIGGGGPRSFAIIAACCSNARSSRTRCNRVSSPRRS